MEQFDLEKWLQDKSRKVVTRDGRPVRILCTDAKAKDGCCIIAAIETDGEEEGYQFYKDGRAYFSKSCIEDCADLFFADEEPESIEIPFGAKDSEFVRDEYYIPEGCEARIEGNKVIIEKIQKEELTEFEKMLRHVLECYSGYEFASKSDIDTLKLNAKMLLDMARKELLKELPKWKKVTEHKLFNHYVCVMTNNSFPFIFLEKEVHIGDYYYIDLEDLKNLPKEE